MKKIKIIIFFITIMLSQFCRTNIVEAASDSIYCGELPKDGSPLVVTYSLEPADDRFEWKQIYNIYDHKNFSHMDMCRYTYKLVV